MAKQLSKSRPKMAWIIIGKNSKEVSHALEEMAAEENELILC